MKTTQSTVVLVGSRMRQYREYALASLARDHRVALVAPQAPSWQSPYLADFRVADPADVDALHRAVVELSAATPRTSLLTWDEWSLEPVAAVAEALGLRFLSVAAARTCRDKYATRRAMAAAGMPTVRHALAHTADDAVAAAATIGLPVVVKPRSLGGSFGVTLARDEIEVRRAFHRACDTTLAGVRGLAGVLLEEYLTGSELSIDSVVLDGEADPVFVAMKRLGRPPYFEEVGHLVANWRGQEWAEPVADLVRAAHRAVGADWGVTHAEVRLTPKGPRLVELNGRLGGDLIPHLGHLATGIDLVRAAGAIALGGHPSTTPTRSRVAEVRFLTPSHDGVVTRLDLPEPDSVPGLVEAVALVAVGDEVLVPPKALTPRTVALIAVADDADGCRDALDRAEGATSVVLGAPADVQLGAPWESAVTRRFLDVERAGARTVSGVRGDPWFRYGAGGGEGLNRPVLLSESDTATLQDDLACFFDLVADLPSRLYGGDLRAFARAVGMTPTQTDLVLRGAGPGLLPLARADLYRQSDGFRLMELNTGSSLGGWQMGIFARALLQDEEFRRFAEAEGLTYADPLAAIVEVLRETAPRLAGIERPLLAITDWPEGFAQTKCWMDFVVPGFEALGLRTRVCHLDDLTYRDGQVHLGAERVDVVYRMFLPGEITDEQRSYDRVVPLLEAAEAGSVTLFAPLDSELYGNKGSLAILSDERNRHAFSAQECAVLDRILPWTRFVRDEKVTVDGRTVDLLPHAAAERQQLVLKPTLLYGGVGVTPGWTVDQAEWEARLQAAVDGPFVVQRRVLPVTERFLSQDGEHFDDMAVAYGVMLVGRRYAGTLARAVPDPGVGIVSMRNGAQIGCAFHVPPREGGRG